MDGKNSKCMKYTVCYMCKSAHGTVQVTINTSTMYIGHHTTNDSCALLCWQNNRIVSNSNVNNSKNVECPAVLQCNQCFCFAAERSPGTAYGRGTPYGGGATYDIVFLLINVFRYSFM